MIDEDKKYLRLLLAERYADLTTDPAGLAACERLAAAGFCRVVHDGPAWRVFQSDEQLKAGLAALAE